MPRFGVFTYAALMMTGPLLASDDLGLLSRAAYEFGRVHGAPRPELKNAIGCVQSQAALLPVAGPEEQHAVHFRKGLCELVAGRLRGSEKENRDAVADLQQTIAKWPATSPGLSGGVRVALAVARLQVEGEEATVLENIARDLQAVIVRPQCLGSVPMSITECERYVDLGRVWLGWIRFRQGRLTESEEMLQRVPMTWWSQRVAGRNALGRRRYSEAVWRFERALAAPAPGGIPGALMPRADSPRMLYEFAEARAFAGNPAAALDTVNEAIKADPKNAQALFLRARLREMSGLSKESQADYELASRTAFANVDTPFEAGYAHYYRGVSLFRRRDFARAENEFASALNFEIAEDAKPDVNAWRSMAVLAGGACGSSAVQLRAALSGTSPLFPTVEAEQLLAGCGPRALTENRLSVAP